MIEVQVPKDIAGYETPFIGPLTARQTVFGSIAFVVEYIYYNVVKFLDVQLDMNSLICIGIIIAVPILYFAVSKPYGMRPETYLYNYLIPSMLAPKDRPYETKLTYDSILEELDRVEEAEELSKNGNKKKKNTKDKKNTKKKPQKQVRGKRDIMYA